MEYDKMAEYKLLMVMSANSTPDQKNAGQVPNLQEAVIYKTNLHNFTQ